MAKASKKKAKTKKKSSGDSRKRLTPRKEARGIEGKEAILALDDPSIGALAARVTDAGGTPVGAYREQTQRAGFGHDSLATLSGCPGVP